jgi:predicted transcriptional regulator
MFAFATFVSTFAWTALSVMVETTDADADVDVELTEGFAEDATSDLKEEADETGVDGFAALCCKSCILSIEDAMGIFDLCGSGVGSTLLDWL